MGEFLTRAYAEASIRAASARFTYKTRTFADAYKGGAIDLAIWSREETLREALDWIAAHPDFHSGLAVAFEKHFLTPKDPR